MKRLGERCARMRGHRGVHASSGQALTEFLVLALVLLPLFLVSMRLGKLLDLYQTTEAASRYGAFEATVHHTSSAWKPDAQLAAELRQRFYAKADTALTSAGAAPVALHVQTLWSDAANRNWMAALDKAVQTESATLRRNVISSAALQARQLQLPNNNRYRFSVTVDPAKLPGLRPFHSINLDSTRTTVVLADTWAAQGPTQVRRRIEQAPLLVPVQAVRPLVDALGHLPQLLFDPALRVGEFDWDTVPCDRLEEGCA